MGSYPLSSQATTPVEVELGYDNCDKPCHISSDSGKSVYDKYEVFGFKLNKDNFSDLNGTFARIVQVKEDDKYIISYDHDISQIKLRLL